MLVGKLVEQKARAQTPGDHTAAVPHTHSTDFAGDGIGCITLTRSEMRSFGYPGHAFACEEAVAGEVLGAVLDRQGRRRCFIEGEYAGDDCYDLSICDVAETLCLH